MAHTWCPTGGADGTEEKKHVGGNPEEVRRSGEAAREGHRWSDHPTSASSPTLDCRRVGHVPLDEISQGRVRTYPGLAVGSLFPAEAVAKARSAFQPSALGSARRVCVILFLRAVPKYGKADHCQRGVGQRTVLETAAAVVVLQSLTRCTRCSIQWYRSCLACTRSRYLCRPCHLARFSSTATQGHRLSSIQYNDIAFEHSCLSIYLQFSLVDGGG